MDEEDDDEDDDEEEEDEEEPKHKGRATRARSAAGAGAGATRQTPRRLSSRRAVVMDEEEDDDDEGEDDDDNRVQGTVSKGHSTRTQVASTAVVTPTAASKGKAPSGQVGRRASSRRRPVVNYADADDQSASEESDDDDNDATFKLGEVKDDEEDNGIDDNRDNDDDGDNNDDDDTGADDSSDGGGGGGKSLATTSQPNAAKRQFGGATTVGPMRQRRKRRTKRPDVEWLMGEEDSENDDGLVDKHGLHVDGNRKPFLLRDETVPKLLAASGAEKGAPPWRRMPTMTFLARRSSTFCTGMSWSPLVHDAATNRHAAYLGLTFADGGVAFIRFCSAEDPADARWAGYWRPESPTTSGSLAFHTRVRRTGGGVELVVLVASRDGVMDALTFTFEPFQSPPPPPPAAAASVRTRLSLVRVEPSYAAMRVHSARDLPAGVIDTVVAAPLHAYTPSLCMWAVTRGDGKLDIVAHAEPASDASASMVSSIEVDAGSSACLVTGAAFLPPQAVGVDKAEGVAHELIVTTEAGTAMMCAIHVRVDGDAIVLTHTIGHRFPYSVSDVPSTTSVAGAALCPTGSGLVAALLVARDGQRMLDEGEDDDAGGLTQIEKRMVGRAVLLLAPMVPPAAMAWSSRLRAFADATALRMKAVGDTVPSSCEVPVFWDLLAALRANLTHSNTPGVLSAVEQELARLEGGVLGESSRAASTPTVHGAQLALVVRKRLGIEPTSDSWGARACAVEQALAAKAGLDGAEALAHPSAPFACGVCGRHASGGTAVVCAVCGVRMRVRGAWRMFVSADCV